MEFKISKELLSEVLGREVTDFEHWDNNEYRCTAYFDGFRQRFFINIYELAYKCKEWALVKGYIIKSEPYDYNEDSTFSGGYFYITRVNNMHSCPNCGANKSEVQAVIDACEWILKC